MSKEELIEKLDIHIEKIYNTKQFLKSLREEPLVEVLFVHGTMGFLITACDYLETNLVEIRNKVQMR